MQQLLYNMQNVCIVKARNAQRVKDEYTHIATAISCRVDVFLMLYVSCRPKLKVQKNSFFVLNVHIFKCNENNKDLDRNKKKTNMAELNRNKIKTSIPKLKNKKNQCKQKQKLVQKYQKQL